ncbi:hypothetical protein [Bradyrhizobium sp.]|uniref:hypothetical protein n=1 Tax=Bradyrhizobium sp. TaxID=376 RepID=UPI003C4EBC14
MSGADYPDGVPPDVCQHFEAIASDLLQKGFARYSADAILHRIRWHEQIERGNRAFKVNDHWSAPLARWFIESHPEAKSFFATRERAPAPIRAYAD